MMGESVLQTMEKIVPLLFFLSIVVIVASVVFVDSRRSERAAKEAAAQPPATVEVMKLTGDGASFPVYVIHDRYTGREWYYIKNGKQIAAIWERAAYNSDRRDWVMEGDEKVRPKVAVGAEVAPDLTEGSHNVELGEKKKPEDVGKVRPEEYHLK